MDKSKIIETVYGCAIEALIHRVESLEANQQRLSAMIQAQNVVIEQLAERVC